MYLRTWVLELVHFRLQSISMYSFSIKWKAFSNGNFFLSTASITYDKKIRIPSLLQHISWLGFFIYWFHPFFDEISLPHCRLQTQWLLSRGLFSLFSLLSPSITMQSTFTRSMNSEISETDPIQFHIHIQLRGLI